MPVPTAQSLKLEIVGARRRNPPDPPVGEIVRKLRSLTAEGTSVVALFDAQSVAGERHLLSAWAHLGRARARGEQRLRDRGAEFALFLAGADQLPRALARVGVSSSTEQFVVVVEQPRDATSVLETFGLVADPDAYPRTPTTTLLDRFDIGPIERGMVPESAWEGLVLERVAMMELDRGRTMMSAAESEGKNSPASAGLRQRR